MELLSANIIQDDCISVLRDADPCSFDLAIADPPYNIGVDYGDGPAADRRSDYAHWCREWIRLSCLALRPGGSLWVISGQEHGAEIDLAIRDVGMTIRNRITWYETFGVYCQRKFSRTSRPIFYATKGDEGVTFNREAVTVPSARQTKYRDKRADPRGRIMGDVWEINRVCGTFKERVKGVPTQLPIALVRRIVEVSSNPGDLVVDPFLGSGTTCVVSRMLGRESLGIEKSPAFAAIARARVAQLEEQPTCDRQVAGSTPASGS